MYSHTAGSAYTPQLNQTINVLYPILNILIKVAKQLIVEQIKDIHVSLNRGITRAGKTGTIELCM